MTRWGRWGRRLGAAAGLGCAAATVIVIVLVTTGTPSRVPSAQAARRVSGATTVRRRDLVQTDTQSGTISFAGVRTVYNRLSGTITWLPRVGQLIKPGQRLFSIDQQPVILLDGTTPAYRDLTSSDSAGPDILELNRNLIALGFDPDGIVVDDVWQAATTAGVELFQASLGESETGTLRLGTVVFLPGSRLIASVSGVVGSTGGGSNTPQSARLSPVSSAPEYVGLTSSTPSTPRTPSRPTPTGSAKPRRRAPATHTPTPASGSSDAQLQAIITLLQAEIAQLRASRNSPSPSKPSSSTPPNSTPSKSGGGATAVAILQTTSSHLVVTVNLPAASQSEAKVGEKVGVQTPSGSTLTGVITAVSPVAQAPSNGQGGGGGGETVPVTIELLGHISSAGLDQATVSVSFAQAKATNVLSVPVTALLATSGTTYAVQEAAAPHRLVPVTVGLFAAGYVQISGTGVYPGLQVTDSQG